MNKFNKSLLKFKYNKFNPSVNEWRNSIYNFNKYSLNTYLNEKIVNTLLNSYFNLSLFKKGKFYSLKRIVVGKPDIKHTINSVIINIYVFNKEKLFYLKKIAKLKKISKKKTPNNFYPQGLNTNKNLELFRTNLNNKLNNPLNIYSVYTYYNNEYLNNNIKYIYKGVKINLKKKQTLS